MTERQKLTSVEAEAILFEYPDADLSAFDVDGDVEAIAAAAVARALEAIDDRAAAAKYPTVAEARQQVHDARARWHRASGVFYAIVRASGSSIGGPKYDDARAVLEVARVAFDVALDVLVNAAQREERGKAAA